MHQELTSKTTIAVLEIYHGGEWLRLKGFDNLHQAEQLSLTLNNNGLHASVTCACGAYAYDECEACYDRD